MISIAATGLPVCAPWQHGERVYECGANPCDHVTGSVQPPFHSNSTTALRASARNDDRMRHALRRLFASQEIGLVLVLVAVVIILTALAGAHPDRQTGETVNNFWNSYTLVQTATDASFFAVMAIGATIVIISGGIDL